VRKIYQDHLTKCEAFIRSLHYDQILPKPKTHELPEKAESVLSQPIAEMIELSRERNLPVLLGDIRLSGLIRPGLYFTVRTLIDIAQRDNRMPIEKVAKVLGEMKLAGLQYISVSDDILIAASDLLIMQENSTTYAALFSQLSPAQSNWPTVLPILTRCLTRFAVMRWINDNQRQNLIAATLSAVFGKSYKRRYLQELALAVRANLELAPIQLRSTMQTIRVWESIQAFQNKI